MHDDALERTNPTRLRTGRALSIASICWTGLTSAVTITLGVVSGSVVLTAFGGVGAFDAIGSAVLATHFSHALRHESFSDRREHVAQLVVSSGLLVVGAATTVAAVLRLHSGSESDEPLAGIVVAAVSIAVLGFLGVAKRRLGARIPSRALITDGTLSLTGGATAACTVAGTGLNAAFGWWWLDPVAALAVATVAMGTGLVSTMQAMGGART